MTRGSRRRPVVRYCRVCGRRYLPRVWHQVACSPACSEAWRRVRRLGRYGAKHRRLRETVRAAVEAGGASCVRCGHLIRPGEPWDLDHAPDGATWLGPAHVRCNRATLRSRKGVSDVPLMHGRYTSRVW